MKIGAFTLENMVDADLENLYVSVQNERIRRADNKCKRTAWVNKRYAQFKNCYGEYKVVGDTVVIALAWMGNIKMATATPVRGDKFELITGIAVAYAKACGERVPDFV